MASRGLKMVLIMVLATVLCGGAAAQSSACTNALMSMSPCLNYITGNSSAPSTSCCSQLASVVQGSPQCLCSVLNGGGSSFGITINQTQAIALPGACNVTTPPISQCNAAAAPTNQATSPVASPSGSPADETPIADTPAASETPSGNKGTAVPPSTTSGSPSRTGVFHLVLSIVFIATITKF